jgi:putative ABC transport system permease protein
MRALLSSFSWRELQHHPWRNAAAVVAVMLGVALAFSVQLINASALSEFSQAVRAVNGQPDLELRAVQGGFDENLYQRVANHPQVALASPVLEISTYAPGRQGRSACPAHHRRGRAGGGAHRAGPDAGAVFAGLQADASRCSRRAWCF